MQTGDWGKRELEQAERRVRDALPCAARVAVVLGSGLGGFVAGLEGLRELPFSEIPHMPGANVPGHAGRLCSGSIAGREVLVLSGRVHLYEGHAPAAVVFGVRLLARLGVRELIVTNAAGGVDARLAPGDLVCIEDHLNLTGHNCLRGANDGSLGPRFVDMTEAYDRERIALAERVGASQGRTLGRGVYAGVLGPSYETPAEIRMLQTLGASLVGMSTVQEVIAARHLGMRVLGLSCVTNRAAGVGGNEPLRHEDVQRVAAAAADDLCALLSGIVAQLPEEDR